MKRTLNVETSQKTGESVLLQGWVNAKRDHGQITFIDLRDRTGIVQIVGGKDLKKLGGESVVEIEGLVKKRPENLINPKLETGTVEVEVKVVRLLNTAKELPFPIDTDGRNIDEDIRLKYRYLDLRRPRLQKNIKIRSTYVQACREYLFSKSFTEIETPMLTKSTPEGSRDFVVPSRLQPGKFYALPQSPQQYKQLLMTAGFERYFQIARCMRDEDPRADRGFEHTQVDLEMSFVDREDVMKLVEGMVSFAVEKVGGQIVKKPFPVVTYQEAMKQYGADKFDLRSSKEKESGKLAFAWVVDFPFFEKTENGGWTFTHNPFSRPKAEHESWLMDKKNIDQILTTQYDLVCNGFEVGGGSLRSYTPEVLEAVFEIMGYSKEKIYADFGHMLEAFTFGAPPHGGCAHGFERLLMAFFGEDYIREVQAFPQTGSGRISVMDAPSYLETEQLAELGLSTRGSAHPTSPHQALKRLLDDHKVKYQEYTHEPVFTSEEAAKVRGDLSLSQGAKALVMIADKQPLLLVLPGDQKADLKAFKKMQKIRDLTLAKKDEAESLTGMKLGAIHPFGSLSKLPTFVHESLSKNEEIIFNAGLNTQSIKLKYADFLKVEKPTVISWG